MEMRWMVGSWEAVPCLVRTRKISYESMATCGPGRRMAKLAGPFLSFAKQEKKPSKQKVNTGRRRKQSQRISRHGGDPPPKVLKVPKSEDSKKNRWDEVARQFTKWGRPVRDRKDSWHKSIKEKPERRVGVLDNGL